MPEQVLAATTTEIREYPLPEIPSDAGILKIEAAGVCGSDWQTFQTGRPAESLSHIGCTLVQVYLWHRTRRPRWI